MGEGEDATGLARRYNGLITAELRPHQIRALAAIRASLGSGQKRPMVQAPTGAGKTILAAAIVAGALEKGRKVCFVVDAISLVDQTVNAFWSQGIRDVGVIQASHSLEDWSKPVQVASIQTLAKRTRWPAADVVLIDEAHRLHEAHRKWMAEASIPFIGLSATPWSKGLAKHFTGLIVAATTSDLIAQKYLCEFDVFGPGKRADLSGVKTGRTGHGKDYVEKQLSEAVNTPELVADVIETWMALGENRPTLVFAVDCAHAKSLHERFEFSGIAAGYQDKFTKPHERDYLRKRFASGHIKVVVNVGTLTTGVDWDVRCIVLARPTKSEILYTQIIGRGLRMAEGKDKLLILDHTDTTEELGYVTQIHHDELDDGKAAGKREHKPPGPKKCPKCTFLRPRGVRECPSCGHKVADPMSEVREIAGQLERRTPKPVIGPGEKQRWWSAFLTIADERGYSRGWAAHKYREKFDVWPRGLKDVPGDTGSDIRNWVRSRQIAYAKAKERDANRTAAQ